MTINARARITAIFAIFTFIAAQCPLRAETNLNLPFPTPSVDGKSVVVADPVENDHAPPLIAQLGTGAEVANVAAASTVLNKKGQKGELLITDSLWGNLILDMAYQRDPELRKIFKRFGLVNMSTLAAIVGIAGGTLAQGVVALATLNPQQGNDTYLPGSIGVGMSGLTIATLMGRTMINHHLAKCLRNRQLVIKHKVEAILAQIEEGNGENRDTRSELIALIGERATNEWLQLWHASNAVASLKQPNISLMPSGQNMVDLR